MQERFIAVGATTRAAIERIAFEEQITESSVVALAVRRLRQELMGTQLATPLRSDEEQWLALDASSP